MQIKEKLNQIKSLIISIESELDTIEKTSINTNTSNVTPVAQRNNSDPRTQSAKDHILKDGLIYAVWLTIKQLNKQFAITYANTVDEIKSGGQHVIKVKHPLGTRVVQLLNYIGNDEKFGKNNVISIKEELGTCLYSELDVSNKGNPPNESFYGIALVDLNNNIVSDTIRGFMLPYGHHVAFEVTFG